MKKKCAITYKEYKEKIEKLHIIEQKYGDNAKFASEKTKKTYDKLVKECAEFPRPSNPLFMESADLYNLWLNRNTDEPITIRELFDITTAVMEVMSRKISSATYQWDGSSTIM